MSNSGIKSETKPPRNINMGDVEMVFGTPDSPSNNVNTQVHITNEKQPAKDEPAVHKTRSESDPDSAQAHQPLLEPDIGRQKPPLAGPEIDDLDDKSPTDAAPFPGIDDGLLGDGDQMPLAPHDGQEAVDPLDPEKEEGSHHSHTPDDGATGTEDGKWHLNSHGLDETDYFYGDTTYLGNGLHNRLGGDDRPISPNLTIIPDVNTYQQKKNLAQGMMDLALLSANANQLRYVLEASSARHPYFYPSVVFITCSILLQIAVGVGLIMNSRYDVNDKKEICKADKINNMTVIGIFLITIVNVFITSFSVAPTASSNLAIANSTP